MEKTYIIIDGNSLINRAFYAMQKPMITKEGIYTQGIFGFLNMLQKIEKEYEPGYISVTFDLPDKTFRHEKYSEYKAGRKHMPPELLMEMPILKDILKAMNISIFELSGYEADDLIGTLSRLAEDKGLEPLIITGDRDQLQLASDTTKVLFTKRGVTDFDLFDEKHFFDVYGFKPVQFIDFKGIFGDKSDNIPGITGIGEKGATELLLKFGTLENIIDSVEQIEKESVKNKVKQGKDSAIMSKWLAKIDRNVPIDFDLETVKFKEPNYESLIELYKKCEFNSFLKKLDINISPSNDVFEFRGEKYLNDLSKLNLFKDQEVFLKTFSDNSHINKPEVYGLFIMNHDNALFFNHIDENLILELNSLNFKIVGHNVKNDLYSLMFYGYNNFNVFFDTEIASYLLNSGSHAYDLNQLSINRLHKSIPKENEYIGDSQIDMFSSNDSKYLDYGILNGEVVLSLLKPLKNNIYEEELDKTLYDVELPLIEVMTNMEVNGIKVDIEYINSFSKEIVLKINELEKEIFEHAGIEFNIKSTKQLGEILFEKLQLPASKKTKTGYSTAQEVLENLIDYHPIIPLILEYRNLTKLQSTYVEGMMPLIGFDGKIRAHFNQTITQTGRISCSDPNLQNIPVRQELGRKLRNAFLADEDYILIGADYSQIELRVLAHLSQDEALITAFNNGEDIHKLTASRVLGVPLDKVTSLERSKAKAVNFGVIYGMSGFGLSEELNISKKDAEEYISNYFKKHPKVFEYMQSQKQFAKENGFTRTITGRKRLIPEINASQFMIRQLGERYAMNSPIQGSAADIIKIAMIKVYNELKEKFPSSKLILQVHDELIINAKKNDEKAIYELLRCNMEEAITLSVKLDVSMNAAENWYNLK